MTEQSDALDALINLEFLYNSWIEETLDAPPIDECDTIALMNEHRLTIRKALTEHAAIKGWQPIAEVKKSDEVDLWANNRRRTNCVWDEATSSWYDEYSEYVHEPTHFMNEPDPPCLSNPPQSDNQTVLAGEDDSQIDALKEALRECLRCILTPDNGVSDVIWHSDHCTLAEFIFDTLGEDIDFEKVAMSVQDRKIEYRCPKTDDFEVVALKAENDRLRDALEIITCMHIGDQPMSCGLSELAYAQKHVGKIRFFAEQALKGQSNDTE